MTLNANMATRDDRDYGDWEVRWTMEQTGEKVYRSGPIGPLLPSDPDRGYRMLLAGAKKRAQAEADRLRSVKGIKVLGVFWLRSQRAKINELVYIK